MNRGGKILHNDCIEPFKASKPSPSLFRTNNLWTQKFGLGLSFSASLSAFPSPRLNSSASGCGILPSLGCARSTVFFFLEVPLRLVLMMRRRFRKRVVSMCGKFYILMFPCHTYCEYNSSINNSFSVRFGWCWVLLIVVYMTSSFLTVYFRTCFVQVSFLFSSFVEVSWRIWLDIIFL